MSPFIDDAGIGTDPPMKVEEFCILASAKWAHARWFECLAKGFKNLPILRETNRILAGKDSIVRKLFHLMPKNSGCQRIEYPDAVPVYAAGDVDSGSGDAAAANWRSDVASMPPDVDGSEVKKNRSRRVRHADLSDFDVKCQAIENGGCRLHAISP